MSNIMGHRSILALHILIFTLLLYIVSCAYLHPSSNRLHGNIPPAPVVPLVLQHCASGAFRQHPVLRAVALKYEPFCHVIRAMFLSHPSRILLNSVQIFASPHYRHYPPFLNFELVFVGFLPPPIIFWQLQLSMDGQDANAYLRPLQQQEFEISNLLDVFHIGHMRESHAWRAVVASGIEGEVILTEGILGCRPAALMFVGKVIASNLDFSVYVSSEKLAIHWSFSNNYWNNPERHKQIFGIAAPFFQSLQFGEGEILYSTADSTVDFFSQFIATHYAIGFTLECTAIALRGADDWLIHYLMLEEGKESNFVAFVNENNFSGNLMMKGVFETESFSYVPEVNFQMSFSDFQFLVKCKGSLHYGVEDNCLKFRISMSTWWNPYGDSIPLFSFSVDGDNLSEIFLGLKMRISFDPFRVRIKPANFLQAKFRFNAMVAIQGISSFKQAHIFIDLADQKKSFCKFDNLLIKEITGIFVLDHKPWIFAENVAELSLSNFQVIRKKCKFRDLEYPYFGQSTGWSWYY